MKQEKIDRINELARLKKQRALSQDEASEQAALRKEYIDNIKRNLRCSLENTSIQDADGRKTKISDLKNPN